MMARRESEADTSAREVRVEFHDAASGDVMIVTHMPAHELPEVFTGETVIDLEIATWRVVRAEPAARPDFARDGELKLWLDRVDSTQDTEEFMEDGQLFVPASRQEELPPTREMILDEEEALFLYEEDWRQNEIISITHQPYVDTQCEAISHTPMGMTHPRTPLEQPLGARTIDPAQVVALFEDAFTFEGVILCQGTSERAVEGAFAFETAHGTIFYGRIDEHGHVAELGVHVWSGARPLLADLDALGALFDVQEYLFVSWCSASATTLDRCHEILVEVES